MNTKLIYCTLLLLCVAFQGVFAFNPYDGGEYTKYPDSVHESQQLFYEPLSDGSVSIPFDVSKISFEYSEDTGKATSSLQIKSVVREGVSPFSQADIKRVSRLWL